LSLVAEIGRSRIVGIVWLEHEPVVNETVWFCKEDNIVSRPSPFSSFFKMS